MASEHQSALIRLEEIGREGGPAGLMRRAHAASGVAVEISSRTVPHWRSLRYGPPFAPEPVVIHAEFFLRQPQSLRILFGPGIFHGFGQVKI